MEGGCSALRMAIQRGRRGSPSPIEIFFSKCRRLFCGSVANEGEADDGEGHTFYPNAKTGESRWEKPHFK